jgi:branched-chain amino acid transport system ATP-binding protein
MMTSPSAAARTAPPIVETSSLTRRFGGLVALSDVNMAVSSGEILGIVGPNGAGKSTLFSLLAGLQKPSSGSIRLNGQVLTGRPPQEFVRQGVVKTFQSSRLFTDLSVAENVMVGGLVRFSKDKARLFANQLLGDLGISHLAERSSREINVSERVLVEIARALATRPKVLLLDEVMAPLDRGAVDALISLLQRLRDDHLTIILIEHHMPPLLRLIDRIIVLNFGKVIAEGDPVAVLRTPEVVEAYLGSGAKV